MWFPGKRKKKKLTSAENVQTVRMQIRIRLTIELRDFGFCSQEDLLSFFIFFSNLLFELLLPVFSITELQKNTKQ